MSSETPPKKGIKESALAVIRSLPDDATWADLRYRLRVREKLERGLDDIAAGRVVSHEEVMRKFGIGS